MKSSEYSDQTENFRNMVANEADISVKSVTLEPEMEDCDDTMQFRNLIKELGLEESLAAETDPLTHNNSSPDSCVHCKLLQKLASLQTDITKMNQEICTTNEILVVKKEQNSELKQMIKNLEKNVDKPQEPQEAELEKTSQNCSCMSKCIIY